MRLTDYAKNKGLAYNTVWKNWKAGKLKGYKLPTGTIIITEDEKNLDVLLKDIKNYCESIESLKKYHEIKKILEC